jgi:hypothetical protein
VRFSKLFRLKQYFSDLAVKKLLATWVREIPDEWSLFLLAEGNC